MVLFRREFIAVPEDRKNQLVYKWPDVTIRRFTRAIVNADEIAVFVNTGKVVQTIGPGRHRVDANELPGLGAVADSLSGGNAYRAELYFIGTKEFTGVKFGGRLDDVMDPRTEQIVTLRVFGEYAVSVTDPIRLITGLVGTVDLADPSNVEAWCAEQLLKCMKVAVTRRITHGEWPVLGLSAFMPEIETAVRGEVNLQLYDYGLAISRMGNFDINLAPEDAERLKRLAKDIKYIQLTGSFQQYAAGEMALGAGEGMAHGGEGAAGGFLAAGMGLGALGQQVAVRPALGIPPTTPSAAPTPAVPAHQPPILPAPVESPQQPAAMERPRTEIACARCDTANPAGARFCMGCGELLAQQPTCCASCGHELPGTARFCGSCGTPVPS